MIFILEMFYFLYDELSEETVEELVIEADHDEHEYTNRLLEIGAVLEMITPLLNKCPCKKNARGRRSPLTVV